MDALIILRRSPRLVLIVEPLDHTGRRTRWLLAGPGWLWCRGPSARC